MRSLRLTAARFLMVVAVTLYCSSCLDEIIEASDCGPAKQLSPLDFETAAQALTSPYLEVGFEGNKRSFTYTVDITDVCPEAHAKPEWIFSVKYTKLPPGWVMSAGWATSIVNIADVPLKPDPDTETRTYRAKADVDMQDGAVNGVSRIFIGFEFAFTSQGSLAADQAVVQAFWDYMFVSVDYRTPAPN